VLNYFVGQGIELLRDEFVKTLLREFEGHGP